MTSYFALRVSPRLKDDFYAFCKRKGLSAGTAVKMFVKSFLSVGADKLGWSLLNNDSVVYGEGDNPARVSILMDAELRMAFSDACAEIGVPMSVVVRSFMFFVVKNDSFPFQDGQAGCP